MLEERYKCLKKATQGMESYILYLFTKIEENGRDLRPHGHSNARKRAGKQDRLGKSSHGGENSGETSKRTHQNDQTRIGVYIDAGIEGSFKDIDDRGERVTTERHPEEEYRTCDSYERQISCQNCEIHTTDDGFGEVKSTNSWTESETTIRGTDDEKEKHVNDSGIESSGIV